VHMYHSVIYVPYVLNHEHTAHVFILNDRLPETEKAQMAWEPLYGGLTALPI
jgi:hypothetical protein